MFRHILGTTLTRIINALLAMVILLITTRNLGREGLGTIALIVLGITLILLINNYVGGGVLVFLASRYDWRRLLWPSYLWAVIVSGAGAGLLRLFGMVPPEYTLDIMVLSLLQSFMTINLYLLLGREKIRQFNTISVIQMFLTTAALVLLFYAFRLKDIRTYVYALYTGYLAGFIISLMAMIPLIRQTYRREHPPVLREMLRLGKFIQTANVLQLLNYRLSFYLIEFYINRAALGLFNVGVQVSEGVWLIGKSVATVQYARISNSDDRDYARRITLMLFKFTLVLSLLVLIVLVCLPESVYGWVLGQEFAEARSVILSLASGILATALSLMFSHYFSGTGQPVHNMVGSAMGVVVTLVSGLIFIPRYGIIAAGLTASVSYLVNMVYLMTVFTIKSGVSVRDFMIRKADLRYLMSEIRKKDLAEEKPDRR